MKEENHCLYEGIIQRKKKHNRERTKRVRVIGTKEIINGLYEDITQRRIKMNLTREIQRKKNIILETKYPPKKRQLEKQQRIEI